MVNVERLECAIGGIISPVRPSDCRWWCPGIDLPFTGLLQGLPAALARYPW